MKKKLIISLMVALTMTLIPASAVFAYEPPDSKLVLENKDPKTWDEIKGDGIRGVLRYDDGGSDFSYALFAEGLDADTGYSLIYYADPWAGGNPGALITESTTNANGKIPRWDIGSVDLGMSLPHPDDANYPDGAKIWLVPSADYDSGTNTMIAWNPESYLFERNLITYELVAPAPNEAYNRYKGLSGVFWVEVFNYGGFDTFKWDGWESFDRVLAEDVIVTNTVNGVNEVTCSLYIPEGTHLSYPGRPGTLVTNLFIERDDGGGVYFDPGNMDFSQTCSLMLAYPDGSTEVTSFTQIRDGLLVPAVETMPAS